MAGIYIGQIDISDAMASKIMSKHGVSPDEVRAACSSRRSANWHYHSEYGWRLLVVGWTGDRLLKIILQPVDPTDGTWRLRTAFRATRP